jgi:anti-sigma factor RsiW
MNCAEIVSELMEMPAGSPVSASVSKHLPTCAACTALEEQIRNDHAMLRRGYGGIGTDSVASTIAATAIAATTRRAWQRRVVGWSLLPIAAAVILVLLPGRKAAPPLTRPAAPATHAMIASQSPPLAVTVPPGKNVIVFRTRDPKIDVVWIY